MKDFFQKQNIEKSDEVRTGDKNQTIEKRLANNAENLDIDFKKIRITSYNVCYTKLLRWSAQPMMVNRRGRTSFGITSCAEAD